MKLSEFIKQKTHELVSNDKYRSASLEHAEEVGLFKNSVVRDFTPKQVNLDKEVQEVSLSHLKEESSITKTNDNGVSVVFGVVPKGKRKAIRKTFYVLYV